MAQSGMPGPVFVEMPIDTLYPYKMVEADITGGGGSTKTLAGKITNFYLQSYLHNMFTQGFNQCDMKGRGSFRLQKIDFWNFSKMVKIVPKK